MSITKQIAGRLNIVDKLHDDVINDSKQLLIEAKKRHSDLTNRIFILSNKRELSEKEEQEYAELVVARQETEKAYNMLNGLIKENA